jgi:hypothetical protein
MERSRVPREEDTGPVRILMQGAFEFERVSAHLHIHITEPLDPALNVQKTSISTFPMSRLHTTNKINHIRYNVKGKNRFVHKCSTYVKACLLARSGYRCIPACIYSRALQKQKAQSNYKLKINAKFPCFF